jgi:hypothetical protein
LDVLVKKCPKTALKDMFWAKMTLSETIKDFPGPKNGFPGLSWDFPGLSWTKKWLFIAKFAFLVKKTIKKG